MASKHIMPKHLPRLASSCSPAATFSRRDVRRRSVLGTSLQRPRSVRVSAHSTSQQGKMHELNKQSTAPALSSMWREAWRCLQLPVKAIFGKVDLYPEARVLYTFTRPQDLDSWQVATDTHFGGSSVASFQLSEDSKSAVFQGSFCRDLPEEQESLVRSGYCSVSSKVTSYDVINLEGFRSLQLRVKGDGHTYIANVRVENFMNDYTDVYQAPFTPQRDIWHDVEIPFMAFVQSRRGRLMINKSPLPTGKIISFGVGIAAEDTLPSSGDFALEIQEVSAVGAADIDESGQ